MFVVNISNQESTKTYKVISQYHPDGATTLTVLDNETSYCAKVLPADLEVFAKVYQLGYQQYLDRFQSLLSKPTENDTASVENGKLVIYRDSSFIFFEIPIEKTDYFSTVANLIQLLADENCQLSQTIEAAQKETQTAINDSQIYQRKLEEYVEENEANEDKLYSSFVQLLNEKKRRIQLLTDMLMSKSEDNDAVEKTVRPKRKRKLEVVSSDEESEVTARSSESEDETIRTKDMTVRSSNYEFEATPSTSKFDGALSGIEDNFKTSNIEATPSSLNEDVGMSKVEVPSTSNIEVSSSSSRVFLPRRARRTEGEVVSVRVKPVEEVSSQEEEQIEEVSQVTGVSTATDDTQSLDFTSQELYDRL